MKLESTSRTVTGVLCHGVLLEYYRYPPGPPGSDSFHSHDNYQFCLSLDFPGTYCLSGRSIDVPPGTLSIIHPGELHAAHDPIERRKPATFRVFYLSPQLLQQLSADLARRPNSLPTFTVQVIAERSIVDTFLRLHATLEHPQPLLAQEYGILATLTPLLIHYADTQHRLTSAPDLPPALNRVRDYLHTHIAENISLVTLAQLADLSPFQLCRAFRALYGMPPHHYQLWVRIEQARHMLAAGEAPAHVAATTGFADQSHFGRHFKRLVGVTPGVYAAPARTFYTS